MGSRVFQRADQPLQRLFPSKGKGQFCFLPEYPQFGKNASPEFVFGVGIQQLGSHQSPYIIHERVHGDLITVVVSGRINNKNLSEGHAAFVSRPLWGGW